MLEFKNLIEMDRDELIKQGNTLIENFNKVHDSFWNLRHKGKVPEDLYWYGCAVSHDGMAQRRAVNYALASSGYIDRKVLGVMHVCLKAFEVLVELIIVRNKGEADD